MKKVIFLDIDGVLNDHGRVLDFYCGINPQCVKHFNRIIDETGADIVLSSAWRYMIIKGAMTLDGFRYLMITHGIKGNLIGHTCSDEEIPKREKQIVHWFKTSKELTGRHLVLDDLPLEFDTGFIRTNGLIGLTATDADRAIEYLNA